MQWGEVQLHKLCAVANTPIGATTIGGLSMSKLNYLCISAVTFLVTAAFSVTALAQQHAVGVGKVCPEVSKVGDTATCSLSVTNTDGFGDALNVSEFWDLVGRGTAWEFRNPTSGNLPIIEVDPDVVCTAAPVSSEAPLGLIFPCNIPGVAIAGGSLKSVTVQSTFTIPADFVPADDTNPQLPDQANVIVQDACDVEPIGCTIGDQQQQFGAAVSLFTSSLEVTKTGPDVAKVGDEITFTIGFVDTSTPLSPALENCTGSDTVLGDLGAFEDGVPRDFLYTVQGDDPDPLVNVATITCDVAGYDNVASDDDDHTVDLIDPGLELTKTGPETAKVGDEISYQYCLENTGTADLEACVVIDSVIGNIGGPGLIVPGETTCGNVLYTVQPDDPNPLVNVATATCDVAGFDNQANAEDDWSVGLIDPMIDVTKTGPATAKVGDEVTYTIGFTATNDGQYLGECTGSDTVLGDLGVFVDGVTRDFLYTVQPDDPDPLLNVATITCDVVGFDNVAEDSAEHTVDLFEVAANLAKVCYPDPVNVGADISWDITINNTGEKDIDCLVDDATAGFVAEPLSVVAGGSGMLSASRTVVAGEGPAILNTATATCTVPGYDNTLDLGPADAECEVIEINEYCRTPGFWKTHAGTEKEGRSTNLTQEVIDFNGGTLGEICGVEITNTSVYDYAGAGSYPGNGDGSAVEGMCVHPKQRIIRQLQRQLIAASINCVVSDGTQDCTGVSVGDDWKAANDACVAEAADMSDWIEVIDSFNNGLYPGSNCSENIRESVVFENVDYKVPGPAGSSRACSAATSNDFYLVPMP